MSTNPVSGPNTYSVFPDKNEASPVIILETKPRKPSKALAPKLPSQKSFRMPSEKKILLEVVLKTFKSLNPDLPVVEVSIQSKGVSGDEPVEVSFEGVDCDGDMYESKINFPVPQGGSKKARVSISEIKEGYSINRVDRDFVIESNMINPTVTIVQRSLEHYDCTVNFQTLSTRRITSV